MTVAEVVLKTDSDWGTFQLITPGAEIGKISGLAYSTSIIFTDKGVLVGQPNQNLQSQVVTIKFKITTSHHKITFFTGHGDNGTTGPQGGIVTVVLGGNEYTNNTITGDGLNIKGFVDVPVE